MDNGLHSITDEQYFAEEGLSNSYLWKLISETPAHAQIKTARTDAMALGSAVHLAVLQPEEAAKMIVQGPADRRGMTMRDKVWNNQSFASILSGEGAVYEQAAFWEYRGKKCKCKVDVAKPGVIIDLKTSASAGPRDFSQSVAKYGYHQQAASYQYGYGKASGTPVQTFLFLVIEKTPPFAPAIYELDAPTIAEGWASYVTAVEEHINCETNNHFPAYADEKVLLQLPAWAFKHTNPRSVDLAGKYN